MSKSQLCAVLNAASVAAMASIVLAAPLPRANTSKPAAGAPKNFVPLAKVAAPSKNLAKNLVPDVSARAASRLFGVNLAGADFGPIAPSQGNPNTVYPGTNGTEYAFPKASELDYYLSRGRRVFRLPFRWERMQPKLNGPLDADHLRALDEVVDEAAKRKMLLLLDCHNYGRYNVLAPDGKTVSEYLLGAPQLPFSAFADFWKRMAQHYGTGARNTAILGYGLMNEPHDMGLATAWPQAAQAATDAIRAVDKTTAIYVAGDSWSGAHSWRDVNENLDIKDASNNIVYEAHQYFDSDSSGTYRASYEDEAKGDFGLQTGVNRVRPFVQWCREKNRRGFVGEFGIPDNDARWLVIMDNFLAYLQANNIGGAYWAGGPRWPPGDHMALEWDGKANPDRPQMGVLKRFPGGFPVAREVLNAVVAVPSLLLNGDFETDNDKDDHPDTFERQDGITLEKETLGGKENRFLRLKQSEAGEFLRLYHAVPIPAQHKQLELQFRARATDVKHGRETYHDARFIFHFLDANRAQVNPDPAPLSIPDSEKWTQRSVRFNVPDGAAFLVIMPSLYEVQSGTLDIDDLRLVPLAATTSNAK